MNNKKNGRFYFRVLVFVHALYNFLINIFKKRCRPRQPRYFLIAHHLLLGDTLMLTAMLANLRNLYPDSVIYFLVSEQFAGLYEKSPYNVRVIGYDPRIPNSFDNLKKVIKQVDIAFIPGDNRFSMLAYSLKSKWIVAFEDVPGSGLKNLFVDEFVPLPKEAINWEDMNLQLINSASKQPDKQKSVVLYNKKDWPAPSFEAYPRPENYVILHVGASTPLKYWQSEKWFDLANRLDALGYQVVWTASYKEKAIIEQIDPLHKFTAYSNLSLPQLWDLIEHAILVICPDTGVAHLAKITDTPVIVLFGQGSDVLFGKGSFFNNHRFYKAIIVDNIPCRDQNLLFKRPVFWVRRCNRTTRECQQNICMDQISVDLVYKSVIDLMQGRSGLRDYT
ncbi:Lipopolysaccharide core heptosyltransferase RfaQ [Methylococcales bacterium]|nr:Lipopolysaccharide core heptosyltransferase RfaQ [Methylococcales bacterium]